MPPESVPKKTLAEEFMERYLNLKIDRSTVSKILKRADGYQFQDDVAETTFYHHLLVKEKACQFAQAFVIPEGSLTFSNGWATKFKKRNGIRKITMHGEATSAPLENLLEERKKLVTVLLYSNSTGSHKFRLLVIAWMRSDIWEQWLRYIDDGFRIQGKQVLLLVDNAASHKTPGTNNSSEVQDDDADESLSENDFNDKIEELQEESQGRSRERPRGRPQGRPQERSRGSKRRTNITHSNRSRQIPGLTNVTVHFLPPNMTAHIQLMDAGIINSFKSKYKKLYCRHLLTQFEKNEDQR
ncbi:7837_t:CDS:2 [Diversispora eburnea]|uniref:7837_t:CDS:1 n=1 Tax=Diversispora eburnea TaxID=1213867 RepID=A0A9N9CQF4_9GLOM|nr:7837_t:CDS:2 [Diversispora eburnea]